MKNPYDFVRIDWNKGVNRRSPRYHDRFDGLSGCIKGTITTLTPLFIPNPTKSGSRYLHRIRYERHITNSNGDPVIPGSSLKGLVRNLVETIGYGCWWLFSGEYHDKQRGTVHYGRKLKPDFQPCPNDRGELCVACRIFGLIQGDTSLKGHVGFDDAVCTQLVEDDPFYTIILSAPKPHHQPFYLDKRGNLAGRKFYFHHSTPPIDREGWRPKDASSKREAQNQYLRPLGTDSVFTFSAHFDNLAPDELNLLLYALALEKDVRHKIGYGKPAGLGSVHIELTELQMIDYEHRYDGGADGTTVYKGDKLASVLASQLASYRDDEDSVTLQDLRRIWRWPGPDDIQYPSWQWFQKSENKPKRLHEIE